MIENVALFLASRQKRLNYWLERFKAEKLPSDLQQEVTGLLTRYAGTITRAARSVDEAEQQLLFDEIGAIDRELTSTFDSRRLLTSELGIARVTDCSTRGRGGSVKP